MMTATGKTTIKKKNKKEAKLKVNSESKCESCASGEGLTLETLNCKLNRLLDIIIEKEASEIKNTDELKHYINAMYTKLSSQMVETEELININCDDIQNTIEDENVATRKLIDVNGNVLFKQNENFKNDINETCEQEAVATRELIWDKIEEIKYYVKVIPFISIILSSGTLGLLIYMLLIK